jgi:phage repressor protein C with HTH and peptisase S24 domain
MTDLERVEKLIKWLIFMGYGKNEDDLGEKLGYSKSGFSQLKNGHVNLSNKFINNLCSLNENINKDWIKTGEGTMFSSEIVNNLEPLPGIPLIPIESVPGFSTLQNSKYEIYVIPEFNLKGAEFLIKVSGNSMYPKFSSGDVLACRRIPVVQFFQWGNVYILETSHGILIKRIHPCASENNILCISENKVEYPPFELQKSEIISCYIVLGLIHVE